MNPYFISTPYTVEQPSYISNQTTAQSIKETVFSKTDLQNGTTDLVLRNLTVNGDQTVINTVTVEAADPIILIGKDNTDSEAIEGFIVESKDESDSTKEESGMVYDKVTNRFYLFTGLDEDSVTRANVILDTNKTDLSLRNLYACGQLSLSSTTDSTSTSTGGLIISGGAGIKKSLYVGGTINSYGVLQFPSELGIKIKLYGSDNTTLFGFGIKDYTLVYNVSSSTCRHSFCYNYSTEMMRIASSSVTIYNTTDSTSTSTGGLIVNGGIGVSKNMNVGGTINEITVPDNSGGTFACTSDIPTNYVTTDTSQTVSGQKTFSSKMAANGGIVLPTSGGTATVLNYYEEGSFTMTATFNNNTAHSTTYFTRVGNLVSLQIVALSITVDEDATGYLYLDGLPSRIEPTYWQYFMVPVYVNSVKKLGQLMSDPTATHDGRIELFDHTTGTFGEFTMTSGSSISTDQTHVTYTIN